MHANRNYRPKQQKTICPTLSDRKQTKELSPTVECCYLPPRIWYHEPDLQIRVSSPVSKTAESIVFLLANEKSNAVVCSSVWQENVLRTPTFPYPPHLCFWLLFPNDPSEIWLRSFVRKSTRLLKSYCCIIWGPCVQNGLMLSKLQWNTIWPPSLPKADLDLLQSHDAIAQSGMWLQWRVTN